MVRLAFRSARKIHRTEVVNHVPRADDQEAFVAQSPEFLSDIEVLFRRGSGIYRQRRDRNVGIWEKMRERGPNAVVQPAFDGRPYPLSENFVETSACRRVSRRSVGDSRKRIGKTVEIVNRFRAFCHVDELSVHVPMRAYENDRLGFFKTESEVV